MGKAGYREKIIDGVLHLFCTQCLAYLPPHAFYLATYVRKDGTQDYKSECKFCHTKKNNKRIKLKRLKNIQS